MDARKTPDPAAMAAAQAAQSANPGDAVILFGSRARGDHRADSDMDILIVCRDSATAADSRARRAMKEHFAQNPPRLGVDVVTLTEERFNYCRYCRRAPNHVAGQAMRDGIIMSGERLDYRNDQSDEYPRSWPNVKERLQATYRNIRGFETDFEHNRDDRENWANRGQQAVENSIKAWTSAAGVAYRKMYDLDDVTSKLLSHPSESRTLAAQQLILLKNYTTCEDPRSGTSYRMTEDEQHEFRREILTACQTFANRAHELTGTTREDPRSDRGMYKFVDLEGKWLSGAFSVLNRRVDKGIVAS